MKKKITKKVKCLAWGHGCKGKASKKSPWCSRCTKIVQDQMKKVFFEAYRDGIGGKVRMFEY